MQAARSSLQACGNSSLPGLLDEADAWSASRTLQEQVRVRLQPAASRLLAMPDILLTQERQASGAQATSSSSRSHATGGAKGQRMRLSPRSRAPAVHLSFLHDGDQNGVCHFLGTNGSCQEWINPMLAGRLQVQPRPGLLPAAALLTYRRFYRRSHDACLAQASLSA